MIQPNIELEVTNSLAPNNKLIDKTIDFIYENKLDLYQSRNLIEFISHTHNLDDQDTKNVLKSNLEYIKTLTTNVTPKTLRTPKERDAWLQELNQQLNNLNTLLDDLKG